MKKHLLILTTVVCIASSLVLSCQKEGKKEKDREAAVASIEKGEALFTENNCAACHQIDQKVIGPGLQETAKIYKAKNGSIVSFLKEEAEPIVNQELYETMKINLQVTKTMSDLELQSIEMYILSHAK